MTTYDYPTVEWVKDPVDRVTGRANGRPIERRHFADCEHWYRNEDGSLVGAPPRLATDEQMASLAPCADCTHRARRNDHTEQGDRLDSTGAPRQFWWVSQGYNFDIAIQQQTLWSLPKKGRDLPDRRLLKEMRKGDVVLHYADQYLRAVSVVRKPWRPASRPEGYRMRPGDGDDGWLVEVDVQEGGLNLHFRDVASFISTGNPGPLDRNGTPRQLYVARLDDGEAKSLLHAAGASIPVLGSDGSSAQGLNLAHDFDSTDDVAVSRVRREQTYLRRHLLNGRTSAACALCGRLLPSYLLIAAHIVPRRDLDDAERLDFRGSAMLACLLGCDALFESGHLVVDEMGTVRAGRTNNGEALNEAVAAVEGMACDAHNEYTAQRFAAHRASHLT